MRMPRLRDGRSIRTVSALLLQLIQSSAHKIRVDSRRINRDRQQQNVLKRQDSAMDTSSRFLDDYDTEVSLLINADLSLWLLTYNVGSETV